MRRYLIPLIFGLGGVAVLASLGFWQLQRLEWKQGLLAGIEARIGDAAVPVPQTPDRDADQYLPVAAEGDFTGDSIRVIASAGERGPGFRVVSAFRMSDGRLVMVDEGFVGSGEEARPGAAAEAKVVGNLLWPDEVDSWTPEPDVAGGLFYARDAEQMAQALGTEPVLIVARTVTGTDPRATPMPVTTEGIPNNHLGYAVQWFGLAAVWLGMTLFLLWRIRQRTV